MDNMSEFLRNMGMKDTQWDRAIQPNSSYLIIGDGGTGKSQAVIKPLTTPLKRPVFDYRASLLVKRGSSR